MFQELQNWQKPLGGGTLIGMTKILFNHTFEEIISIENLLKGWSEFVVGKRSRADVQKFELHLMDHLFDLHLTLHPTKISLQTVASGFDFLGWIHFIDHSVLRTATKRRMMKRIESHPTRETFQSYLGLLKHRNTKKLQQKLMPIHTLSTPSF